MVSLLEPLAQLMRPKHALLVLTINIIKQQMKISLKKLNRALFSTRQCKEMMHQDFRSFVNQQFLNEDQEDLVEKCSESLKVDQEKEERIKHRLINQFFNRHKKRNQKEEFRERIAITQTIDRSLRKSLQLKVKQQLAIIFNNRPKSKTPQLKSQRYGDSSPLDFSFCRPFAPTSLCHPQSSSTQRHKQFFSTKIDTIIEQSNRLKTRKALPSRRQIKTASDRFRESKRQDKAQKKTILNRIISNDIDEYLKSLPLNDQDMNPENKRASYEQRKRSQLSPMDKYSMSFINYIREKTYSNIQKSIYNEKIRQKDSYIQKFQRHILQEFRFSDQSKHRLEKVFESIELQFKGPSRNRQMRERIKSKR